MVNTQEWLDKNYPKEERKEVKKLNISNKDLEGDLDLSDFSNLEVLDTCYNKITGLSLRNCQKITFLGLGDNFLTKLDLSSLDSKLLTYLSLWKNKFASQDLSFLSRFTNLEHISLGGGNKFCGSLEHLKNMKNLKDLHIEDNDIDSGLECLPESVRDFRCSANERPEAKVRFILQGYKQKLQDQLAELNTLIFPNQFYNFNQLKQEISRLKYKELVPQVRKEKQELEQLTANIKNQAGTTFAGTIDLLLQTQQQILAQQKENDPFARGQLKTFEKILLSQTTLTAEKMQSLLAKQKEVNELVGQLKNLQVKSIEQTTQIQPNYPFKK